MTVDEIGYILTLLPRATVECLALGPMDDDEGKRGCRVCEAMDITIDRQEPRQVTLANKLLDYHDIDGSSGPKCYQRCLQIYRAAGWGG